MPNYDFICPKCRTEIVEFVKYNERDTVKLNCRECDTVLRRKISMPMVMKASYPDGKKREGWSDMVSEAKLREKKVAMDWRSDDVKEINKELDEREKKTKK